MRALTIHAILTLSDSCSQAPRILRVMGIAVLAVGLVLPVFGVDSATARIEWEVAHRTFLRLEGLVFVWAGYVVYKLSQPAIPS